MDADTLVSRAGAVVKFMAVSDVLWLCAYSSGNPVA